MRIPSFHDQVISKCSLFQKDDSGKLKTTNRHDFCSLRSPRQAVDYVLITTYSSFLIAVVFLQYQQSRKQELLHKDSIAH